LSTRAHAEGDEWRVHGQKVWTSRGAYSRYGLLLARHDATVPKHKGITAFAIELASPGVDVRPLRQMNGDAHFTEVFLDDARVPDTDRIGAVGEGWRVALTCLSFERGTATTGSSGGLLDVERLIALARERGVAADPVVRDRLARLVIELRVMSLTIRRARDTTLNRPARARGVGAQAAQQPHLSGVHGPRAHDPRTRRAHGRRAVAHTLPHRAVPLDPGRHRRDPTQTSSANGCSAYPKSPASTASSRSQTSRSSAILVPERRAEVGGDMRVGSAKRYRVATALVASCLLGALVFPAPASAAQGPTRLLGPVLTRDEKPNLTLTRDGGMSLALPNGRDLWVFGDGPQFQFKNGAWSIKGFVAGSSLASGPYRRGHVPAAMDEIYLGHKPSKKYKATVFIPPPHNVYFPNGSRRECSRANGAAEEGRWPNGAVLMPNKSFVLVTYDEACVTTQSQFTVEGWGFVIYNWKTNKITTGPVDVFKAGEERRRASGAQGLRLTDRCEREGDALHAHVLLARPRVQRDDAGDGRGALEARVVQGAPDLRHTYGVSDQRFGQVSDAATTATRRVARSARELRRLRDPERGRQVDPPGNRNTAGMSHERAALLRALLPTRSSARAASSWCRTTCRATGRGSEATPTPHPPINHLVMALVPYS